MVNIIVISKIFYLFNIRNPALAFSKVFFTNQKAFLIIGIMILLQLGSYGSDFLLSHSIHLLEAIKSQEEANVSELAAYLEITSGAVSQGTKKLLDKELIESYKKKGQPQGNFFPPYPLRRTSL